jgi:hypothetical protein
MKKNKIDIIIPSKDRALQLHLLLESMNKFTKGIEYLVITWQGSNDKFKEAYILLEQRVKNDINFDALRKRTQKIIFIERNGLSEVYDAYQKLSEAKYVMPLVDDDVFLEYCDFNENEAIQYFFNSDDVHACALRLGNNLSSQVSITFDTGKSKNNINGHASSVDSSGKPRFIYPLYTHFVNKKNDYKYCLWYWTFNQNIPHWSLTSSVTGYIYDKKDWFLLLNNFGKDNFLKIEAKGQKYYINKYLGNWKFLYEIFKKIDYVIYRIFLKKSIYQTDFIATLFLKVFSIKDIKDKKVVVNGVKTLLLSPKQSIIYNINLGFSNHRKEVGSGNIETLNLKYLNNFIIDIDDFNQYKIIFPWNIIKEFKFSNYSGLKKNIKKN